MLHSGAGAAKRTLVMLLGLVLLLALVLVLDFRLLALVLVLDFRPCGVVGFEGCSLRLALRDGAREWEGRVSGRGACVGGARVWEGVTSVFELQIYCRATRTKEMAGELAPKSGKNMLSGVDS